MTTTERDDLAKLIFITDNHNAPDAADLEREWDDAQAMNPTKKRHYVGYAYVIADGLLAAGYRKSSIITTAGELEALRLPAIVDCGPNGIARVDHYDGPGTPRRKYAEFFLENDDSHQLSDLATWALPATSWDCLNNGV